MKIPAVIVFGALICSAPVFADTVEETHTKATTNSDDPQATESSSTHTEREVDSKDGVMKEKTRHTESNANGDSKSRSSESVMHEDGSKSTHEHEVTTDDAGTREVEKHTEKY